MNVLVDNSGYKLVNLGDVAMLQVAVRRLAALFPRACVRVITSSPERLARYCPAASPVAAAGLTALLALGYLPGRFRFAGVAGRPREAAEGLLRKRAPAVLDAFALRRAEVGDGTRASVEALLEGVESADLLVVSGGGFFTDAFRRRALGSLELLRRAARRQTPAAMLGQGIGPVSDTGLRDTMRELFPAVAQFGLREAETGPGVLQSLGVPASRVAITGDDAIELASGGALGGPGRGLGVNVREASYARLSGEETRALGPVLQGIARAFSAPIVPIPIARSGEGEDSRVFATILDGWDGPLEDGRPVETPADAAARAGLCRLVIAGSYHAAVFALSQGVPAIGLVRSAYYAGKFRGLAGMFGEGCEFVDLEADGWEADLEARARRLWDEAERLGPRLREAASRQVESGRQAYGRLKELA